MSYFSTREEWLTAGCEAMIPRIEAAGYVIPKKWRIACGFPVGSRGGKKILGQCISPEASAGSVTEMFLSPTIECPKKAMGVALHEMGHLVCGIPAGHGPVFKKFCNALGLEGKATEAFPGAATMQWIEEEILPLLGGYPHNAVDPSNRKKQGTRMIKLVCPVTGYTVRTTKKWLAEGVPVSPAGYRMEVANDEGDEE